MSPLTRSISVLVVDDHPAVRAGLRALVDAEPGLAAVDATGDTFAVGPAVYRLRPDVVVMDYQLPGIDGLSLCRELTHGPGAPAVLIYSAFATEAMIVSGHLARAAAIADKTTEPRELAGLIRRIAEGERPLPPVTPELLEAAGHRLEPRDVPILELLVTGETVAFVADTLGMNTADVELRVASIIARLGVRSPPT